MEMRTLGRTGVKVGPLLLGAMMFGDWGNKDHDDSVRIIHASLDAGITFVDTADVYSRGESEEIVGKALKGRREHVVLAPKAHGVMGEDPNQQGNNRRWLVTEVENSLRRLQTDHIDIYQIHRPSEDTDIEETLDAPTDLQRAGKIRCFDSSPFLHPRSCRRRGRRRSGTAAGSSPSNRRTRSWSAASSATCCRSPSSTAWAPWCGARWPAGGCPASGARVSTRRRPTGRSRWAGRWHPATTSPTR